MSQKNKGIYSLLSNTFFYSLVQRIMSATSFREKIVKKYITKNNIKVLDIGCGPAEILNALPRINYYGFDINPLYINSAKKKYGSRGKFFCKKFTIKEDEPLCYFSFGTDRPIEFIRFKMNDELKSYSIACSSSTTWNSWIPLADRYKKFKDSRMKSLILKQIERSIV